LARLSNECVDAIFISRWFIRESFWRIRQFMERRIIRRKLKANPETNPKVCVRSHQVCWLARKKVVDIVKRSCEVTFVIISFYISQVRSAQYIWHIKQRRGGGRFLLIDVNRSKAGSAVSQRVLQRAGFNQLCPAGIDDQRAGAHSG